MGVYQYLSIVDFPRTTANPLKHLSLILSGVMSQSAFTQVLTIF